MTDRLRILDESGSTKRVIFCGSRDWIDRELIATVLRDYREKYGESLVVVHGSARGADTIADEEARKLGIRVEAHPADWNRYGKSAGHVRNEKMAALGAEYVEAFWDGTSRGTWNMVKTGERHGIRWSLHCVGATTERARRCSRGAIMRDQLIRDAKDSLAHAQDFASNQRIAALNDLVEKYPLDCPSCGLWLTADSRDCPRCMTKFTPAQLEAMRSAAYADELCDTIDALALNLTNYGHTWSPELRSAYERAIALLERSQNWTLHGDPDGPFPASEPKATVKTKPGETTVTVDFRGRRGVSAECKKLRGPNDTGPDCGCRGDACALGRDAAMSHQDLLDAFVGRDCGGDSA